MEFKVTKLAHGWAEMRLSHGNQKGIILASHIRDSPAELLAALVQLLRGSQGERVIFEAEPGYSVMRLRRLSGDLLRIEVSGGPSEDEDPEGPPWLVATLPMQRFARRVHSEFARLLHELGPAGYQKGWGEAGFPKRPFDALGELLEKHA